jgi:hypothetical protein
MLLVLGFSITNIILYLNLLLGNDVLIKINLDKNDIFLLNNESDSLSVKVNILTNPFCYAKCRYLFLDVSNDFILETNNFTLKTTNPLILQYEFTAPLTGTGQKLYRFEVTCKSIDSFLCHAGKEEKYRNSLITLNYDLNEHESLLKNKSKFLYLALKNQTTYTKENLLKLREMLLKVDSILILNNSIGEINNLIYKIQLSQDSLNQELELWENQNYSVFYDRTIFFEKNISVLNKEFYKLVFDSKNLINSYNNLIINFTSINLVLKNLSNLNLSNKGFNETKMVLEEYSVLFNLLNNRTDILLKETKINEFRSHLNVLYDLIRLEKNSKNLTNQTFNYSVEISLLDFNHSLIEFNLDSYNYNVSYELKNPELRCCFLRNCYNCCDDSCKNDPLKYPVLFLHGHDFSESISPEYNLNLFEKYQRKLEQSGYINGGSYILVEEKDSELVYGKPNLAMTFMVSYYFDVLKKKEKNTILYTKKDNIDTYSLRLNDVINSIKKKTNKNKVILVSHSMGGLVIRRYLQIFGENNVYKAILIASPNKGIESSILEYCSVFGSKKECDDMNKDSLFINKLDNADVPNIPVYNIIGIGCHTDNENGDGIVKNSSSHLEYAKNYYINGTCNNFQFEYLHTKIIDLKTHPETFLLLREILLNES